MKRLLASGGLQHGVYFTRTAGLTVIRTARETPHTLPVRMAGTLAILMHADGHTEAMQVPDEATLARWACRLAVELGGAVELRVTTTNGENQ